jgi:putative ABC transport system ATP-binding protein
MLRTPSSSPAAIIAPVAVRGLTRHFRRGPETVTALDGVSFELNPGELTVTAGPSGSGKTTLLSILAGLERVDAGQVVTGEPLPAGVPAAELTWRYLSFVPQSQALLEELSVRENIDLPARLDRNATGLPTDEILEALEIGHLADRYPSQISGGEQQRTAIARALRLRPYVLIGDEPTGHQDRHRVDVVLRILRQHAYAGNIVLISSHDEDVISAADRVITLADGRLVSDEVQHGPLTVYQRPNRN